MRSTALILFLFSFSAAGSGYEKSIPFGGQTAGVAGIGTPYIQGAQALYFNPAGLAADKQGKELSLNVSPTWVQFKSPTFSSSRQDSAEKNMLLPFGFMYGQTINESMGWGAGIYTSGGSSADYKNVAISPFVGVAEFKTEIRMVEIAGGFGYKVNEALKVGASWRIVHVAGEVKTGIPVGSGLGSQLWNVELRDLKDTNFIGFKLGAQYKFNENSLFGITYRSETGFKAKGTWGGTAHTLAGEAPITERNVTVGTVFPSAITLGFVQIFNADWRMFSEYVWTQYSKVYNLAVNAEGLPDRPIELQWKDQHNLRVAAEYKGWGFPFRFGYIWTSQVTNNDYALPTMTPPGPAGSLTLGTAQSLGNWQLDEGIEYSTISGTKTGATQKSEVTQYALHFGAGYSF